MERERPRRKMKRKKSFTDALKQKYCVDESCENMSGFVIQIAFHGKPKTNGSDAELAYLRNVVLSHSDVCLAGLPAEGLQSLCPNVVDLDLSDNSLTDWGEVLSILEQLPCLKFVNVARNTLKDENGALSSLSNLPSIENLVLNETMVTWDEVLQLSKRIQSLKELHICGNEYDSVPCNNTDIAQHLPNLNCLRLNDNRITSWDEVWKLRHLPNLESLILSKNPLLDLSYDHKSDDVTDLCDCSHGYNSDVNGNKEVQSEIQNIVNDLVQDTFRTVEAEEMEMGSFNDIVYIPHDHFGYHETTKYTNPHSPQDDIDHDDEIMDSSENEIFEMSIDENSDNGQIVCNQCGKFKRDLLDIRPFPRLSSICLSKTKLEQWHHIESLSKFPALKSVRVMDIGLTSDLSEDDRRKLQIASLPNITILNGSEVTSTEREKAEYHYLRHFMDKSEKPQRYYDLEKKHGKPKPIRTIQICPRGFQEWINLTLVYQDQSVTSRVRVVEPVGKLRLFAAKKFCLYASLRNYKMFHYACGPFHEEEDKVFEELPIRCENLPMSRFDIMEGDQVHIDLEKDENFIKDEGLLKYICLESYLKTCDPDPQSSPIQNTPPRNMAFVVK